MKIEIEVGGVKYYLSRLDTTVLDKFIRWADSVLPNPIDVVRDQIKGFPEAIQLAMVQRAQEDLTLRRSGQSTDVRGLMASPDGARKIIGLLLAKHQPSLTEAEVHNLITGCEEEHGLDYLKEALEKCTGGKKDELLRT